MARVQTPRLLDEMMIELQTVETLNCLIERTETPPFYRLTIMRKASSHSDGTSGVTGQSDANNRNELGPFNIPIESQLPKSFLTILGVEKGTIHTKRHSGEDPLKTGGIKSETQIKSLNDFNCAKQRGSNGANLTEDICTPTTDEVN